jgi:hypothetical protein
MGEKGQATTSTPPNAWGANNGWGANAPANSNVPAENPGPGNATNGSPTGSTGISAGEPNNPEQSGR